MLARVYRYCRSGSAAADADDCWPRFCVVNEPSSLQALIVLARLRASLECVRVCNRILLSRAAAAASL